MTGLLRTLEAEAEAISRFVELLRLEQAALGNGDTDDLASFARDKNVVSSELALLADQRNATLTGLGLEADRTGIEAWLEAHASETRTHKAWSKVIALAGEARELNRVNGKLIQIHLQHNTQALAAIQGASRTLHLYGPDGQTAPFLSQRINDAV